MENNAELIQKARILKEAIDMEMSPAVETRDRKRDDASTKDVLRFQHMYGVVAYLLGDDDPENLGELVQRGRDRIAGARQLLEDYPNLRDFVDTENTEGESK